MSESEQPDNRPQRRAHQADESAGERSRSTASGARDRSRSAATGERITRRKITAPGNLLLLGEYAVTEEGGVGLALGAGPRGVLEAEPAGRLSVTATMGTAQVNWPEEPLPLVESALRVARERGLTLPTLRISLDTGAFFTAERKLGFGSSAAAAVLIAATLTESNDPESTFDVALAIHRELQGGRGSGYDVAASAYGGLLRFRGGRHPVAEPVELPWMPPLFAVSGDQAVPTRGAIGAYTAWKQRNPGDAAEFLRRSNDTVERFIQSRSWKEAVPHLLEAKRLGETLGRAIGVSAEFPWPPGADKTPAEAEERAEEAAIAKAVGAGAEMGVLFLPGGRIADSRAAASTVPDKESDCAVPLEIGTRGLSWQ